MRIDSEFSFVIGMLGDFHPGFDVYVFELHGAELQRDVERAALHDLDLAGLESRADPIGADELVFTEGDGGEERL